MSRHLAATALPGTRAAQSRRAQGRRARLPLAFAAALVAVAALAATPALAQEPATPAPKVMMLHRAQADVGLHAFGWQFGGRYARAKRSGNFRYYEFEFAKLKHPKETRVQNTNLSNTRTYIYGKQNSFGTMRGGYGLHRVLAERQGPFGVEVSLVASGGVSVGLLKPVYLDVAVPNTTPDQERGPQTRVERFDIESHLAAPVVGTSDFSYGLDEISVLPGAYGKVGIAFELGRYEGELKGIEAGLQLDAFTRRAPIMVLTPNKAVFVGFYIKGFIGRQW